MNKISMVIPYIDNEDILLHAIEYAEKYSNDGFELLLIDNGSQASLSEPILEELVEFHYRNDRKGLFHTIRYDENMGVLNAFKEGLEETEGDIIVFPHSDVLIHEEGWDQRIIDAFEANPGLGMLGFFGAKGTGSNGGRIDSMSNMQGKEWGQVEGGGLAALHHGRLMTGFEFAGGLDGLCLVFRRSCLAQIDMETDAFADWRAPFHFYDRMLPCKAIELGWQVGALGVAFDHKSGTTACTSDTYRQSAVEWLTKRGHQVTGNPDHDIYLLAERQFFAEYGDRLPVIADSEGNYTWGN